MRSKQSLTNFSKRLKEERERLGLTQDELAKRTGVSRATIIALEKGESDPPLTFMLELSEVLNVSLE